MKWLFASAVLTALVMAYATVVRPWMRNTTWGCDVLKAIEPFERWVYLKSETLLVARWHQFVGVVLSVVGFLGGIDWSLVALLTPDWIDPYLPAMPLILNVIGTVFEALRRDSTKPIEVVALPQDKPPEVAAAVEKLELAKKEAVAAAEAYGEAA